jgi:hypothetical protein
MIATARGLVGDFFTLARAWWRPCRARPGRPVAMQVAAVSQPASRGRAGTGTAGGWGELGWPGRVSSGGGAAAPVGRREGSFKASPTCAAVAGRWKKRDVMRGASHRQFATAPAGRPAGARADLASRPARRGREGRLGWKGRAWLASVGAVAASDWRSSMGRPGRDGRPHARCGVMDQLDNIRVVAGMHRPCLTQRRRGNSRRAH